ncbi:MAG: respiratory nitrate reductase subunit gamma [Polyangiaceae bacterium]|nr:respiratory nitrate reductase subunit gamma [Polyangiaceae bacterium]
MLNLMLYGVLPYLAIGSFFCVSVVRYLKMPFTFSSLSTQFLESKQLFWGSVPFHIGILTLFAGHLVGFMFPRAVMAWNGMPVRLLILETTAMIAAFLALVGLTALIVRRAGSARLRANTTVMDVLVYVTLLMAIGTGLWVALAMRWGSAWYTHTLVPYLWSVFKLNPDVQLMVDMKLPAQLHVISAFLLIGVFSFTRLVHAFVAPLPYLWRPPQQVIWNRARRQPQAHD